MKRFWGIALLFFVAAAGWKIGENLSTDALGMALGVIFGMMAGIPAALIALSASRQKPPTINNYFPAQELPAQPVGAQYPPVLASQPRKPVIMPQNVIVLPGKRQERIGVER